MGMDDGRVIRTGIPDLTGVSLADLLSGNLDPQLEQEMTAAVARLRAEVLARDDAGRTCCGPYTCGC